MELIPPSFVQSDELDTKDGAAPSATPTATSMATAAAIAIDARTSTNGIRCCSQMLGHSTRSTRALKMLARRSGGRRRRRRRSYERGVIVSLML